MVAGVNASGSVLDYFGLQGLHPAFGVYEINSAAFGAVKFPTVSCITVFFMAMDRFISISPAGSGQQSVRFVFDSGIEISEQQLGEILGILCGLGHYNLGLFCFGKLCNVVQVSIQHTELPAGLAVAKAYPVAVASPCRLPGSAAAYGRSLGKPVASLGNELVTFFAEKDNVLSYKLFIIF